MALTFARTPYALLKDRRLKPIDKVVIGLVLEWCIRGKKPAPDGWVLNHILAKRAGVSIRTVQRSIDRLGEHGWIATEADHSVDGRRRIFLLWMRPGFVVPSAATGASRHECHDTVVMTPVSPNKEGSRSKKDHEARMTMMTDGSSSSSSSSTLTRKGEGTPTGETTAPAPPSAPADPVLRRLVALALEVFPGTTPGARVAKAADDYGADWVEQAIRETSQKLLRGRIKAADWTYVLGILANWRREGGPSPTVTAADRLAAESEARRRKNQELAARRRSDAAAEPTPRTPEQDEFIRRMKEAGV